MATYSIQPTESEEHRKFVEMMFDGLYDVLRHEDYATMEKVQQGLDSGAVGRITFGRSEPALQMVHAAYDEVLERADAAPRRAG